MTLTAEQVNEARARAVDKLDEVEATLGAEQTRLRDAIHKLDNWLWANTEQTAELAVESIVDLRDRRTLLKEQYEIENRRLKAAMETREAWLLNKMNTDGLDSMRVSSGTAYIQTKTKYNVADWLNYWAWLQANGRLDLLEKRPAQGGLAKMEEAGEEMPPGLNRYTEKTVTIRRA